VFNPVVQFVFISKMYVGKKNIYLKHPLCCICVVAKAAKGAAILKNCS
jgi:hypothetical protein